jgi:hypothetical protein
MAQVVYAGAATGTVDGGLFAGKKFWFSQKLPQRSHFIGLVKVLLPDIRSMNISLILQCNDRRMAAKLFL